MFFKYFQFLYTIFRVFLPFLFFLFFQTLINSLFSKIPAHCIIFNWLQRISQRFYDEGIKWSLDSKVAITICHCVVMNDTCGMLSMCVSLYLNTSIFASTRYSRFTMQKSNVCRCCCCCYCCFCCCCCDYIFNLVSFPGAFA